MNALINHSSWSKQGSLCSGEHRGWAAGLFGAVTKSMWPVETGGWPEWQWHLSPAHTGAGGNNASSPITMWESEESRQNHLQKGPQTVTKLSWDRMSPRLVLARRGKQQGCSLCLHGLQWLAEERCSLIRHKTIEDKEVLFEQPLTVWNWSINPEKI